MPRATRLQRLLPSAIMLLLAAAARVSTGFVLRSPAALWPQHAAAAAASIPRRGAVATMSSGGAAPAEGGEEKQVGWCGCGV